MVTHRSLSLSRCVTVLLLAGRIAAFSPHRAQVVAIQPSDASLAKILLAAKHYSNPKLGRETTRNLLHSSTVDIDVTEHDQHTHNTPHHKSNLLAWKDIFPISLHIILCLLAASLVSTYEDYDVTHTRPNPSTIRRPTHSSSSSQTINYLGAATRGMGWGIHNRMPNEYPDTYTDADQDRNDFEHWYGYGATALQWKPSYNEIMLQHRTERVTRWTASHKSHKRSPYLFHTNTYIDAISATDTTNELPDKEQLQRAVLNLYQSLDDLEELKIMADDYRWDEIKDMLTPVAMNHRGSSIRYALEYSLDVIKYSSIDDPSSMSFRTINYQQDDLPTIIGFDWGSCAWRHCGAKADAQEALAELYSNVGMLEPFECRFVIGKCRQISWIDTIGSAPTLLPFILSFYNCTFVHVDIIERSLRDVISAVPDEFRPHKNGVQIQVKPYTPYESQADKAAEGIGLDYEYVQALSDLRVDLSE
ncbi:hypothetical protein ACHAWX_005698 [Stephanocyclus meneghinianus]